MGTFSVSESGLETTKKLESSESMRKAIKVQCEQPIIFDFVCDYRNVNFLLDEFLHFEPEFTGPIKVGNRYRATGRFASIPIALTFVVSEYVPHKKMMLQARDQLDSRVIWEIQPGENNQHLLCLQVDLNINSSIVFQSLLMAAGWMRGPIINQIQNKQQSLITNALLKARQHLEKIQMRPNYQQSA